MTALSTQSFSGLVTVTLQSEGKPYVLLLDSGSNVSYLDESVVASVPGRRMEPDGGVSLFGESGPCESAVLGFHAGAWKFRHRFCGTDLSVINGTLMQETGVRIDGVLGADFLTAHGCVLDFKSGRLIVQS